MQKPVADGDIMLPGELYAQNPFPHGGRSAVGQVISSEHIPNIAASIVLWLSRSVQAPDTKSSSMEFPISFVSSDPGAVLLLHEDLSLKPPPMTHTLLFA